MKNKLLKKPEYTAGLVSQSFWFVEFKKYLQLQQEIKSQDELKDFIVHTNLFGVTNEYRAKRIYGYIASRARMLFKPGVEIFFEADLRTQKLLNLICILRQDKLFFDFINEVYRENHILGLEYLQPASGDIFFRNKAMQSDLVASWQEVTKKRLYSCYLNFLTDAGLLESVGKKKKITPPFLEKFLEHYLYANNEELLCNALTGVY